MFPSPGFSWEATRSFLAPRAIPGLEEVTERALARALRVPEGDLVVDCRFDGGVRPRSRGTTRSSVRLTSCPEIPAARLRALGVRLFDLARDLGRFRRMAARDPVLRRLGPSSGSLRIPQLLDPFEGLVRAILGQQVSLAAARTLAGRLVARLGRPAPEVAGVAFRYFPSPEAVTDYGAARLRSLGLTGARAEALHGCAAAVARGTIRFAELEAWPLEEAEKALVSLPGVGRWTASYVLMRAFARADAFPAGDLGVRRALERILPGRDWTPARVRDLGEAWRPFRAYATFFLWRSLGVAQERGGKVAGSASSTRKRAPSGVTVKRAAFP